ncbi:MAG: hypothetical protein EOP88_17490 [Verrucomicrobiaceae bacterium]|nr:MAG: hypothetical protein EOP88_17490 [Verrucomicrobiaceae bacterium]
MSSPAASCSTVPTPQAPAPDPEAALSSALWQTCRAEAEAMWNEIHRRLRADEARKAAFIDHIARDLMNKTTCRRRGQLLRQLAGDAGPTDCRAA